jgi:CheY-like chemotaxis protein
MPNKILIVDDEPYIEDIIRQKFRKQIKENILAFEYVANGLLALEKLKSDDTFDLMLTDINMPVMDGLTLLEKIKENKIITKAIVVSAYADLSNIRTAMNRGAFDFITKPIDLSDLEATILKTISEMEMLKKGLEAGRNLEMALLEKAEAQQKMLEALQQNEKLILEQNTLLEQQVADRTSELNQQKKLLEEKNKEILDSIHYASYLQKAILPSKQTLNPFVKESFIYYQPKDIVAGDFYWIEPMEESVLIVVADCTGHGVAGALMSMLGVSLLNHIVRDAKITSPADILNHLRIQIAQSLNQTERGSTEGMDIAVCNINLSSKKIIFSGANRPLVHIGNNQLTSIAGNKFAIGGQIHNHLEKFENHTLDLNSNDVIYLFTDGYADQFGGEKNKKLMSGKLKELLLQQHHLPMTEQKTFFSNYFQNWRQQNEQVDDVLLFGIRL